MNKAFILGMLKQASNCGFSGHQTVTLLKRSGFLGGGAAGALVSGERPSIPSTIADPINRGQAAVYKDPGHYAGAGVNAVAGALRHPVDALRTTQDVADHAVQRQAMMSPGGYSGPMPSPGLLRSSPRDMGAVVQAGGAAINGAINRPGTIVPNILAGGKELVSRLGALR